MEPSDDVNFCCCVQVVPSLVKAYTAPWARADPGAPTRMAPPEIATL